jgi:hypothetical protein
MNILIIFKVLSWKVFVQELHYSCGASILIPVLIQFQILWFDQLISKVLISLLSSQLLVVTIKMMHQYIVAVNEVGLLALQAVM